MQFNRKELERRKEKVRTYGLGPVILSKAKDLGRDFFTSLRCVQNDKIPLTNGDQLAGDIGLSRLTTGEPGAKAAKS
jgi:hypothetical protein